MPCSVCLWVVIVSSMVILEKVSDAKVVVGDELQDQLRGILKNVYKQHIKRDTNCSAPYHVVNTDGQCVWSCGTGTTPDNNSNECICQSGYYQTGTDQFGRRTCTICPTPYHVVSTDGRCVWSCGTGTTPDNDSNECVCQSGYYQTGTDQFGRRTCTICPTPYHVVSTDGRCVWSCGTGTTPDNNSNECVCKRGYHQTGTDKYGRRICSARAV